ncbi:hypothetical protein J6590_056028 [Homalodisca vitripennis]|nr:hypothetical protein J6590_056028 [Homalodisca vitripennis]
MTGADFLQRRRDSLADDGRCLVGEEEREGMEIVHIERRNFCVEGNTLSHDIFHLHEIKEPLLPTVYTQMPQQKKHAEEVLEENRDD